jgi:ubiquinone/menaquinone biosynthesis C-methylase UbiE
MRPRHRSWLDFRRYPTFEFFEVPIVTIDSFKASQAEYYDHQVEDPEFEINRPHGESRFYRYLMDFKFKRVMGLIGRSLQGSTVLVSCCGSGMDAEYLARSGAGVVAMDISGGCLGRARVRAHRYGVDYALVRGDAENLPFADSSFDYVFVHDGLHHLREPERAIREMARVAQRGILITEPADARLTKLLIGSGLMKPYEEAGNYVIRFDAHRLEPLCRALGFDRISSSRYMVKYGHPPGGWWRRLDMPPLFEVSCAVFRLLGVHLFGRWGNKMALVAERSQPRVQVVA